jgi:hypothetical protein
MKTIGKLNCKFRSQERLEDFYARLSVEELRHRKKKLLMRYLMPGAMWLISVVLIAMSLTKPALFTAYLFSAPAVFISLFSDYRRRLKIINRLLQADQ